jgi:rhodanese-related sulfurtransferase
MGLFDFLRGGGLSTADEIPHAELAEALQGKALVLVDVREPGEFAAGHVPGSSNMPLSRFDAARLPKDMAVVLICRTGGRSASALSRARAQGRPDIRHYRGGVMGWARAGGKLV